MTPLDTANMNGDIDTNAETPATGVSALRALRAEVQTLQGVVLGVQSGEATLEGFAGYIKAWEGRTRTLVESACYHMVNTSQADDITHISSFYEAICCSLAFHINDQQDKSQQLLANVP